MRRSRFAGHLDPTTTITSIDGTSSAFDLVSRRAMLSGLHKLEVGNRAWPFPIKLLMGRRRVVCHTVSGKG